MAINLLSPGLSHYNVDQNFFFLTCLFVWFFLNYTLNIYLSIYPVKGKMYFIFDDYIFLELFFLLIFHARNSGHTTVHRTDGDKVWGHKKHTTEQWRLWDFILREAIAITQCTFFKSFAVHWYSDDSFFAFYFFLVSIFN